MIDRIKALSDKTFVIIGIILVLIATTFAIVIGSGGWKNFIYNILYLSGFSFFILAYDKKRKSRNKKD